MIPRVHALASVAATSTPFVGHWFQVPRDSREHRTIILDKTAGTGTVKLEGRNSLLGAPVAVTLNQGGNLSLWFPQMRVSCADPAAVAFTVTIDTPSLDTGA